MHTCDNFCIKSIFIYNKGSILRNVILLLSFTIMVLVIILIAYNLPFKDSWLVEGKCVISNPTFTVNEEP